MQIVGIIPARYASTRFPGKPLVDLRGKTMIQRVYEQASKVLERVVVATDDDRIETAVKQFGGKVVMTSSSHRSGTDRCAEAAQKIDSFAANDVIVNIQGDEPFIEAKPIQKLIDVFENKEIQIATLVKHETDLKALLSPDTAKVVCTKTGDALYFSRSIIPYVRGVEQELWANKHKFLRHLGLYAYRFGILTQITKLNAAELELTESLEQNRWLENDYKIRLVQTQSESLAIDTPEDLKRILASGLL